MRLISPVIPGAVFVAGGVAELTLRGADNPLVQPLPVAILLGIATWVIIRYFQHERDTARKFEALEKEREARERQQATDAEADRVATAKLVELAKEEAEERIDLAKKEADEQLRSLREERGIMHQENVHAMAKLTEVVATLSFTINGSRGAPGLADDIEYNREVRHGVLEHLTIIEFWIQQVAEREGMPDWAPPRPIERRRRPTP
jgi:hypothetical protein